MTTKPRRTIASKIIRPSATKGHIYEYFGWSAKKLMGRDDSGPCVVTLKDLNIDEMITRNGKIYACGGEHTIFLNSIEGCKEVQLMLHSKGEQGRVIQLSTRCVLQAI